MAESKPTPANTGASGDPANMSDVSTNTVQSDVAMLEPDAAVQGKETVVDSSPSSKITPLENALKRLEDHWDYMMERDFDPKDAQWLKNARSVKFDKINADRRIDFMKDLKAAYDVRDIERQLTLWYVVGLKLWDEDQQALFALRQTTTTCSSSGAAQSQHTDPASTFAAAKGASVHRENLLGKNQAEH